MSGWHPENRDGGILPNPDYPTNPSQAFPPVRPPLLTPPNYYGNGCDVRLRPHVINTLISENLALVDSVGMNYNPSSLLNQRTAVEYVTQKGIPKYVVLNHQGDPTNYYTGTLSPPLLNGYNNGMVLCVIPTNKNQSWIRIDVGGGWWVPVLRNDHQELEAEDWPAWVPQLIGYFNGAFFMLGICKSQVPIVLKGAIDFWVRWDGNDTTGDGTENKDTKAFRTIEGCWWAVGSRYAGSPSSTINIRLGIPGNYEGATIGPYGATVQLIGDDQMPQAYRVVTKVYGADNLINGLAHAAWSFRPASINQCVLRGVNLVMTYPQNTHNGVQCLRNAGATAILAQCIETLEVSNSNGHIELTEGGATTWHLESNWINGNGHTVSNGRLCGSGSNYPGQAAPGHCNMYWSNCNFIGPAINVIDRSYHGWSNTTNYIANCTGPRYSVSGWSNLLGQGQPFPGNQPGYVDTRTGFFAA